MRLLLEAEADPRQGFNAKKFAPETIHGTWPSDAETTAALLACFTANREMLELVLQFGISANDQFKEATLLTAAASAYCKEAVS